MFKTIHKMKARDKRGFTPHFCKSEGFTLIELLIVVAIIGILAAIAIPAYLTYTVKAKVSGVANDIGTLKDALVIYRNENGAWPAEMADKAAINTTLGIGLAGQYTTTYAVSANGVITATLAGMDTAVNGKTIIATPTVSGDSISITWAYTGTTPAKYVTLSGYTVVP